MKEWQSQAHVKWECKYHVVIVPKYRKKAIYGKLRQQIGEMLRQVVPAEGDRASGGPCADGSRAYAAERAAAVQHRDDGRVSQGQECDTDSPGIRESPWIAVGT